MAWTYVTRLWEKNALIRYGVLLIGSIGLAALMLLPNLPRFQPLPFIDSGVFLYIGWQWTQGQVPYLDLWDHKPPLIYMVDALGYTLTGGQAGVWLLEVIFVGASFFILALALRRWADRWAVVALLPAFWGSFAHAYLRNMTENYALLWQVGVIWLLSFPRWRKRYFFFLGILSGLLLMTRPNIVIGSGMVLLYALYRSTSLRERLRGALLWSLGATVVWLPVLGYFALHHALKDFWDALILFNLAYRQAGTSVSWLVQAMKLLRFLPAWVVWMALVGITIALLRPAPKQNAESGRTPAWVFALLLVADAWAVLLPRRAVMHYAMNLVPAFAFWAAIGLGFLFRAWLGNYRRLYIAVLVAISLFWLSPLPNVTLWALQPLQYQHLDYLNAAKYLNKHTTPDESVFVWSESRINVLAKRRLPTKYVMLPPDFAPHYSQHLERFLSDLENHPPVFIVDTGKRGTAFWNLWASYPELNARAERLRKQYRQIFSTDVGNRPWYFYELRSKEKP